MLYIVDNLSDSITRPLLIWSKELKILVAHLDKNIK